MRYHPLQGDQASRDRISAIFTENMKKRGILPKNPWKAKRLETWLAKMGARFHPASNSWRPFGLEYAEFYSFEVECPPVNDRIVHTGNGRFRGPYAPNRIKGRRESRWVVIEIPWELADKILVFGCLP
jgi:hypothetical protein